MFLPFTRCSIEKRILSIHPAGPVMKNVVVFGSSLVKEGSREFAEAELLGSLLAGSGYGVVNGGYCGTMEAVSKGARAYPDSYVSDMP